MKKILIGILTLGLVLSAVTPVYAVAVGVGSVHYLQGGVTMFKLTNVDDAETLSIDGPVAAWWATATSNPTTQTSAGVTVSISVSGSTNTFTFYPGEDNATVNFFIERGN